MEQSILNSTKKILGIGDGDSSFDLDVITHINTAFSHLYQLGLGPAPGFVIEDDTPTWDDFLTDAPIPIVSAVKTNVFLRVRSLFDPPQQWHIMNSLNNQLLESDTRLSIMRENLEWTPGAPVQVIDGGDPSRWGPGEFGRLDGEF